MRIKYLLAPAVVAAGLATTTIGAVDRNAQQSGQALDSSTPRLEHETFTLKNGLKVILSQDKRLPMVAVNLWYHVGPANETPGRTGFAHLFEHMMFQGSKHVPGDSHIKLLEAAGASDMNGTTDFDRTNYFQTLPAHQLELALWIESDRMGYLLDALDQRALANQIEVVRNERRQSVENEPYGVAQEALYQALYPAKHPYHGVVIGSHADLAAVKLQDVQQFFRQYYTPNNASLAIVGDFEPATTRSLVEKYFGTLKAGPEVAKITAPTPPITAEKRLTVSDTVELPRVYMSWLTPAIFKSGDAEADLAAEILGGGKSSRLYRSLIYNKQIAQAVSATQESLILGSKFTIEVTARPGHTAEELESAINAELTEFTASGPGAEEVERAQNTVEARILEGLETLGGFGGKADRLNSYEHYLGTSDYLPQDLHRYRDATAQGIKTFASTYLQPSSRVVVFAVPGEKKVSSVPETRAAASTSGAAQSVNVEEPWRATRPRAAAVKPARLPVPDRFTLANGLTIMLSERHELPIVSASLVFASGSGDNPIDKPGLANFTVAMLDEGTKTRDALGIANDAAQLGATLTTSSNMDQSQVSITALSKQFPSALSLLADVALNPTLPPEEIERQRASRLAGLVAQKSDPAQTAARVLAAALFGPDHPYGYTELGTEASNKSLSREAMLRFREDRFVPGNAALVVVGDVSRQQLESLVAQAFAAWTGKPVQRAATRTVRGTDARLIIVDAPGAAQTQLRVASLGVARGTADDEAIEVMNGILGGLFTSRINLNLREDKGYTYGAFSVFVMRRQPGPFFVTTGVRTDATAAAVKEIIMEVRKIRDVEVRPEELALGKDSLIMSLPGRFETSAGAAASLSQLFTYELGLDYFSKYAERLGRLNGATTHAAATRYLLPQKMLVVAVGDRKKIEGELRKLNLGKVEYRDAEGNIVEPKRTPTK
ncbi:MAG: pitrilysin family protein [Vicinamibacterales bacterium]